jgi:hypothetical protein
MFTLATDRFNHETWEASRAYRKKKGLACIYAPPCRISESIDINSPVFVIEMNNSTNQIIGIGLIKNKIMTDKAYRVQPDTNYNRYIYIGNYHLSREELREYNPELVHILETILFKGYTHSKRGAGITRLPEKVLTLNICKHIDIKTQIRDIFIMHFRGKISSNKNNVNANTK